MRRIVTGIHHVSIVVTDLERSRRFYTQVLGLREIPRPATFDFVVVWYDLGAQHIHLVPRVTADAPSPRHFALQVEDARPPGSILRSSECRHERRRLFPGAIDFS